MDQSQADLVQRAAAFMAASLREDPAGNLVWEDLEATGRAPDALVLLALCAEGGWVLHTGDAPSAFWTSLDPPSAQWSEGLVDRAAIVEVATAVKAGDSERINAATTRLTTESALASAMDLASTALQALARSTGVSAEEWCKSYALGTAAGVGVEPDPEG